MAIEILNISILDEINSNAAVSTEDGNRVFNKINRALENSIPINLNFININLLTSAFLNAAIGQLYSKFSSKELNEKLNITNISEEDKSVFLLVVKRAKEYFADKKRFNSVIDNVIDSD